MTLLENPRAELAVCFCPIIESREKEVTALLNDNLCSPRKIEEECSRLYGSPFETKSDPIQPHF